MDRTQRLQLLGSLLVAVLIVVVTILVVSARVGPGTGGEDSGGDDDGQGRGRGALVAPAPVGSASWPIAETSTSPIRSSTASSG